jgi:hypothetical protein
MPDRYKSQPAPVVSRRSEKPGSQVDGKMPSIVVGPPPSRMTGRDAYSRIKTNVYVRPS